MGLSDASEKMDITIPSRDWERDFRQQKFWWCDLPNFADEMLTDSVFVRYLPARFSRMRFPLTMSLFSFPFLFLFRGSPFAFALGLPHQGNKEPALDRLSVNISFCNFVYGNSSST